MTTIKKITSLIITVSLVLTLGINVFALGGGTVESLTASSSSKAVTVSGTTQNVAAAVTVQVLDSSEKIIGMSSFVVSNNQFSGTVSISGSVDMNSTLTIRAADSDGGDWYTITNKPMAVFKGYSMLLDGYIGIDYYVQLSADLQNADTKITFTHDSCVAALKTQEVSFATENLAAGTSDVYIFTCRVVPSDMTLPITATLTNGDTTVTFDQFSARQYVNRYAQDTGKLGTLAKNIKSYGYYAQLKFGPNDPIYSEDALTLSDPNYEIVEVGEIGEGISYYGSSVVFSSGNRIKHYFTITGNPDLYTFKIGGKDVQKVSAGENLYSISTEELAVGLLNKGIKVQIFYNGEEIKTFDYSAMNYAKKASVSANNEEMRNLGKSFAMYYEAAINYNTSGN